MSVNAKPKQLVIAITTDAVVFSDYKGSGVEKVVYAASKVGESLGQATGNSFPATGVDFEWIELIYLEQTNSIFGLPQFERKLGYTPSTYVEFKDPQSAIGTGSTTPITPGVTSKDQGGGPMIPAPTGKGNEPISGDEKVVRKSSGLPVWAYWLLGGLGLVAVFLIGFAVSRSQKKGGKK